MRLHLLLAAALFLGTPALAQQSMSMTDLKIDAASLEGQEVKVRAVVMTMGSSVVLTDPNIDFDTSGITANVDRLPREQRRYIVENCSLGCVMTVSGFVSTVFGVPMLDLTNADTRTSSSAVPELPKAPAPAPVRAASLPAATGDQYEYTDENGRPFGQSHPGPRQGGLATDGCGSVA